MVYSSSKNLSIEVTGVFMQERIMCNEICKGEDDCYHWENLNIKNIRKDTKISTVTFIIENISNEVINIDSGYFKAIDKDGFMFDGKYLCDRYSEVEGYLSGSINIPQNTKCRYLVIFPKLKSIIGIKYSSFRDSISLDLQEENLQEELVDGTGCLNELKKENSKIKNTIDSLRQENKELKTENFKLKKSIEWKDAEIEKMKSDDAYYKPTKENYKYRDVIRRADESFLIKYKTIEDDNYFRFISLEKEDTISFNREFDKSKGNYNWINVGDPLIRMRADNSLPMMSGITIIKSPVSGVFEFDSNKLISYEEEICRIKKHPQSDKEIVILELEKQDIKDAIYKKERKKMIERETLDELLSEGKVFNVYTKKDGNRTTIPMDIANAVWNRDGGKCCFCGKNQELEFDHIIPLSKGGATTFRNLQLLCKSCNIIKSDNI